MARTTIWSRRGAAVALAAAGALALSACGASNSPSGSSTTNPGGSGQIGDAPSATATAAGTPSSTGSTGNGGGGGGSNAPTFPKDAKSYGLAVLAATSQKNYDRIDELAVQGAVYQIKDFITQWGSLNSKWVNINCADGSDSTTKCIYRNDFGDESAITMNQNQLGHPTAVTDAQLDKTMYPADPTQYISELVFAYENGNSQRVVRLSNNTVASKITCAPNAVMTTIEPISGDSSHIQITVYGTDANQLVFKMLAHPGNHASAVSSLVSKQCA